MNVSFRGLGHLGRLGNSLFQLAGTVGVARARHAEPRFNRDWPYRTVFCLPDHWFTDDFTDCAEVTSCPEVTHLGSHAVYLQDLSLWADVADEIRQVLFPSPDALRTLMTHPICQLPRPILSVHVRRGDNAYDPLTPNKWQYHPLRPLSYYRQAIELAGPYASLAVFGDDPEWNRAWLPGADFYGDGKARSKEHETSYGTEQVADPTDFLAMTLADRHIISNSTFGLWAAWLADTDRPPIYPTPWFGPTLAAQADASLIFPPTWTPLAHAIGPPEQVAEWDRQLLEETVMP